MNPEQDSPTQTVVRSQLEARIIRANGTIEELGVIASSDNDTVQVEEVK